MRPAIVPASNKISENYCKEFYSMLPPFSILSKKIFIFFFSTILNAFKSERRAERYKSEKEMKGKKW